jgi:hypothetical protein
MTALGQVYRQMQNDAICASQKVIAEEPPTAQAAGVRGIVVITDHAA